MNHLALRALTQIGAALDAYRRQQAAGGVTEMERCEFGHPHPDHPCGRRVASQSKTVETLRDEAEQAHFFSGWRAALEEVLFVADHRNPEEALTWAREHLRLREDGPYTEQETTK